MARPSELILQVSDLPEGFRVTTHYEMNNWEVARRFWDAEARYALLQEYGRDTGHYVELARPGGPGSDGVWSVETIPIRYFTPEGAAKGFDLNVRTIEQVLTNFEPHSAPPLGDDARAWTYDIDPQTTLFEILVREGNYVLDANVIGDPDRLTAAVAASYAERFVTKVQAAR